MISAHASPLTEHRPGGAGGGHNVHVAELARELGRHGHHVTVYTRCDSPESHDRVRLAAGVSVEHVPAGPPRPLATDDLLAHTPEFGRHLARQWNNSRPDIIHAHHWTSGLAALAGAHGLGIPVVQTYHTLGITEPRHKKNHQATDTDLAPRIRLERAIGRTADAVIATCSQQAAELRRMGISRLPITTVPYGVDITTFTPKGPTYPRSTAPRLLMLSHLTENNGVDTAIEALAWVPGAELVIAGGPPLEDLDADPQVHRLQLLAKQADVINRVIFLGRVTHHNVPKLLRSADLVLTLQRHQPSATVSLEAMACRIPVVATAVGCHLDTIHDNMTGIHVSPGNPHKLAQQLRRLLADPTHRSAMSIAGLDRARSRYPWQRIAQETTTTYQRITEPATELSDALRSAPAGT
ncbi:glycosyltransferase [Actinomadura sp. HBU206391]|uniref:glycosyltransferase n=1 Tax=Actinomadura sp. HBU206391 TaxID=2731692 RepID=UPI001C9C2229|nr:glycosyltransferase [Actinomadura sp. HBU206391]